jgi:hypothetical protein
MNGPQDNWRPLSVAEITASYAKAERRRKLRNEAIYFAVVALLLVLFFAALSLQPAEARNRFSVRTSNVGSACQSCNVQKVVPQKVVAAPVVHHAAPVVAAPVVAYQQAYTPPVQNFFYSVGQPLVQEAQLARVVRSVVAEQQFNATVNATINGSISGATQGLYQQPAPQWQPPPEPMPPVQEPPTFSQTAPSQLEQHCAKCHANGAAKGGFSLEGMTGEQLWSAIDRIKAGTMPPTGPLPPATAEAVAKELVARQP